MKDTFTKVQLYIARTVTSPEEAEEIVDNLHVIDWEQLCMVPGERPKKSPHEKHHKSRQVVTEERIQQLRSMPYSEYLQTPEWAQKRDYMMRRLQYHCQVCNGTKSPNVHHRTYKRLGCEWITDLTVLCEDCHELFHKNGRIA